MPLDEERLISLVENYTCLYNPADNYYYDMNSVNNAWEEVAKNMGHTVTIVKEDWDALKNSYKESLKSRASNQTIIGPQNWKHEKKMSFLMPILNSSNDDEYNQNQIHADIVVPKRNNIDVPKVPPSPVSSNGSLDLSSSSARSFEIPRRKRIRTVDILENYVDKKCTYSMSNNKAFCVLIEKMLDGLSGTTLIDAKAELFSVITKFSYIQEAKKSK